MKNLFPFLFLFLFIVSCKQRGPAEEYYNAGVAKIQEKPDPNNKLLIYKEALKDFDKAIALNPRYADAFLKRALIKRALGDYAGGIADIQKVIAINPQNKDAWYFLGQSKWFHEDYQGSIKAYTQAIAIDSAFVQSYYERGRDEQELHSYKEAIKDYTHAIALSSKDDTFYKMFFFSRGDLKLEMNDKEGACADFHKAQELGLDVKSSIDIACK